MGRTRNHGHYVCSTWGNNHFKTFDGDIYQFPGICEYNFASDCQESYKEFSVHIQRALNSNNHPEIQYILITIKDFTVYLRPKLAVVDGRIVKTPYYSSGVLIESNDIYTKVYAKLGLILIWNQEDALMVELDSKFNNHTCGLCGDYNGVPIYNEFINGGASYNSITYGNLQKISKPNTKCEDPDETRALPSCNGHRNECERLLTSSAFADCRLRLNLEMYIQACMQDKCACNGNEDSFCLCSTISEYSRQCSHVGGRPGEWRTQYFCPKTCPDTMIYRESSSPCMDTCSHLEISSLCEEHYMDGCFCPEGTVYDDITEKGCIRASQCHCKLHGKEYSPGESITNECEECTCDSGRWMCKDLPCPGTCSVEGGSHITTFDGKKYTFHGDCYYVLAKGTVNDSHALLAELSPCGSTDRQTCLKTVVLLVDHKKNVVVFRSDGSVLLNEMTVNVPHVSASFSVFKPSSYYLVAQTSFGLQLQIQLFPVMQLFVTVDQSVQGKLQGLCGNFNGMEGDDFKTTSGLVEATGSAFANTWKAQSTCIDQVEKLEDPCSLSTESANYAEHWCSLLKNSEGPFARCHLIIDPSEYYKKCKYDTCLCEDNEECLCAALSSYSRACAFKGIILGGWRKNVCTSEVSACPGNQIFLYNLTMCHQTCRSLADGEKHCLQDFPPMDGCGCPYNTYLDNQNTCVPISKCPCYYKGSYLEPGEYVTKDGERCVCRNAKVQCTSVTIKMKSTTECSSSKMYFDCNASPKWTSQTPLQLSCHTPRTDHFQAECVSGCVCPEGLFDDGKGGCVEEKDCPCIHNNQWYSPGQKITVDCNTCTCQKGLWSCTEDVCYGTCMIYGSGHYITFDGKFYDFDGSCEYVATQDFCGDKNSSGSFSIITENVPCGTTGVTCSKAIKMFLGKTELKLENKDYKEIQRDIGDDVRYWNRTVGLYLVIEASNGVMLIWDKKTTVFIKLTPDYKGKVCGLCGNFDDKSNNDFTTRSGLQETNALKFGNSWKQSSVCPDITQEIKPCDVKPHRKSWAEKECSIIRSEVFKICHSKVDPIPFYEACVHDACSCDSGGDCECFCSAVAAYAQECTKAQACVFWRTPDICPIFCDYYNPRNECDWHYEPCGSNVTTCRMINNVSTNFSVPYLEGCYPRCPKDKPIYNEETKECVPEDQCWCYINGTHVPPGSEIPTEENCTKCVCGPSGSIQCTPIPGCPCVINGTSYEVGEIVAQIQDGNICITYVCAENGSIVVGSTYPCPTSTSPTTISTSFPTSTLTTTVITTSPPVTTTPCFGLICNWTQWFDVSKPEEDGGDYETYDAIRKEHGNKICEAPEDIECRAKDNPDMSLEELGQKVECNVTYGLICKNEEQDATMWQLCYNYEIRVNCCEWSEISCETTSTLSPTPTATSTTTSTTVPITTIVRQSTAITTMPIPTPTITSEFTPSVTTPVTSTSPAPPSSTTRTVSPPPVSTTAPTPTPSEPPSSTATTTTPPRSTTSSTLGTTTMVPGTPAPTPTTASTSMPTPTYTTTSSPPDCDCIWTDWIDVSYPNSSDRNSGDYETFENILKNDSSWVCAKAENISCRAQQFPHIPIADLGQKVECSVNTGLICNNSDQVIGGIIPMPVCLNYEISVCCIPNIPQCITSTTTSTTTAPPSSTTRTVSPPPVSTTAPTPTPSEPPSSTATTTTPPRSTTSSTLGTTTMVPGTPAPTPTTASTSMPTPTYTTTSSPPDCDCIWTDWIDVSYPNSSDRNSGDYETFENILKNDSSWVCAKAENISCRAQQFPHIPIADLGQKVECSVNTGLICNNSDQVIGGIIPMPVCLNYEISVCCIPNIPQCITSTTTSTTTAPPSSTTRTVSPPPVSTTAPTPTPSEPPSSTATTTTPPRSTTSSTLGTTTMVPGTPAPTPTTASTSMPTPTYTTTSSPPDCDCIWTDWIDVSYPNSSDRNSGDYETFENILKNDSSWVCAKAENISCRAQQFPHIPIADLGQKVECSVNTGLICNNSDQVIGGIIPMPVCLNYEISVCCIPNIPQCITSTTTSTTTAPPSSTTRTVSPPPVSTTAPTPTPSEPPSSTATTTTPPRSTTSSTLGTTTMVPGTPAPTPTTASTSMPTPTYTTTSSPPDCDCIWTDWIDVSYPNSSDRNSGDYETFENILKNDSSWVCAKAENISCRAQQFPHIPIADLGQKVECSVNTGLICNNSDQVIGGIIPMPVCLNYEISVCCIPNIPQCITSTTTSTTTAPPSSTTRTVSPPPVSTTAPTPTPSEPPSSTATTTTPPRSTTSSTLGTTTMVPGTPAPTPTTASTSMPTPTYTTTSSPPDCDCIWTDWIDVSYPNSSDRNSGDYETFENILKNDSSWVCAKAENISCRAQQFPHIPIADLGQKVECSVNTGLICNNSDQVIGGIIPMPVCLNYEISVCCIPNIPQCITSTTTSTTTAPPSSTTRTVSPPPVSTTAPTPTPSEPPSSTATTTTPPRSTTSSTLGTTTMVPGTPAPTPTTASTSMPTPTYTTTSSPPDCDCIWTDWIDVSYPNSSDRNSGDYETFENILKNDSSWVCAKAENISCRAQQFPHIPIADLGQKVECSVNTGLICNNSDQVIGGIIPMPVCLNYEISVCCIPNIPQCITSTTTSTTTAPPSSTTRTVSPPPVSTTAPTPTPSEPPSSTATTTTPPRSTTSSTLGTTTMVPGTPAPTPTTASTSMPTPTYTTTSSPPDCDCIWTDWIDVSYPNSSDRNSGDYETFENILKNDSSWVCAKAENISCRAQQFPHIPIADLGQKVECSVNTGLICNNSDQVIGGIIPMPVCLNYEISVCCIPNIPQCITSTTTSTTTAPPSSTTRTVSPPPVSTTAPTPTPSEPPSSTATTTTPPRSTTSSTLGTTTMVPGTPAPTPTTASTSMPTPTYTTTSSPPDCDCIWTDWIDVSYPNSSDRNSGDYETFENILKNDSSWVCAKAENISCRAQQFPHIPIADLGQKVECSVNTGLICNNSDQVIGGIIPMPVCLNYEISVCCIPNIPQCITSTTTSTTTAPPSSTTRTVSPPPVSTTAPTPTPSEPPSSTATTTTPPRSTTSSTLGTTTMVPGTPAPTPTTASTSMPTPTYTTTSSPPDCDCIWTDWIDVSYPNSSDRNSGDYETFENILKNDSSWVCAKAENISCRAQQFPHIPIADLGQKVECSVNTGLICNNSDQVIGGIIPMPVCLNYEISVCCIPNIPQCITSTTTSTTTAPPSSTTRTVSPPPVSTTAPTPTPSEPPSSTATTTTPPRSTTSSTLGTTTMVPGTPAPTPTTATTFTPPTIITKTPLPPSSEAIKGTTPEPRTPISTTVTPSATSQPTTRTTEIQSIVSTTGTTIQQSITSVSTSPVTVSTSGVTETGSTTKTITSGPTPSGPTPHSTTTVMETSSHKTSTTGTGTPPTGPPSSTTSTTTSGPSSPMSTASTTVSPPPVSTSPVTVSTSGVTETGSTTKTTTSGPTPSGPTPHSTTTVMETSSHETSTTGTGTPPTGLPSSTTSTTTSGPSSPVSTASTTVSPPPVSTSPVTVSTSGVTETGSTTKTTTSGPTPSGPTPHSTTTVMETSSHETSTTGTGTPPTGPPSSTTSTTTSGPSSPVSTASTTVSPPPVSTSPVTVSTSGVTETGSTTKTTTSGPTPHSTTTVMETSSHETSTTGTGTPPTGPPSSTTSTTTSGPSSPVSTASTTVSPPPVSTSPVTVSTSGVTETGSTTKTTTSGPTPSGPTPHSTTTVMETSSHETSTTGTGTPPTGPPSSTTSTTTSGPSSPMSTASTTVSPPPVSTSPVTVSTSGVTETGSTTKTTTSGPTPHSTTTVMETSSHETSTTGTGTPPTGPPSSTTSTTTSGPSSPVSTASTTVSPPPVSTSPVTVSMSGVTETGSTTKTTTSGPTPSGPTPHSTTTVMETSSHETSTTGTGTPPTGPPSSTTSTTTSGPSSPVSTASTTVSPPPVSTSPVTVSTSGVTETGSTTISGPTSSGPTPHSTMTVTETGSPMTTTATHTTPTRSTAITTTMTSGPSSVESAAITTVSLPSVSTSIMPVTTSGTTPTESFTTTLGTTSRNFTTITATTTTSTSEFFSPGSTSTSGPTATSSSVTITGSSTYSTVTPLSASSSTTTPPPTTPGRNCSVFPNESYAPGESWWICDCIKAICIEDNIIQVVPVICNPPPKPTCANGLSPVQVIDEDGCCWHWECDCYCTGWGDPHYMTFDGLYYSYQGNCTYVLVEEIYKKVDNFGVYIDNYHCDTRDVVSCPRTLIVRHETQEVRMATVKPNTLQVEVTVNKQAVALPYKKFGLSIYESGINRVVEIPELKMNVTYNGLSFSIRMPYSLFGNNTHGQCGTCNNNTADDCMLPNGNIAENCETMADHWQVVDPSKPQCSPGLIPTKAPSTTPTQPCKESSICELLLGSLFEPCHGFVQPEKYYAACVFDSCVLPNLDLECSSLQTYAATCADQSVCIDWRSHTNGVCSYKCPSDKEYRACGPIKEITCKSSQQNETSTKQVEGCFCPNGTMLYDSGVDVCVKTCGCVGMDKIPREFGEKFTVDCQDCICLEGGNGIVCEPHECAKQNKTSCDGEGFYEVNEVNSEDSCCPIVTCKCNTSLCTSKAPKCTLGFEVHSHIPRGQCCPVYQCVPKRVCVHQNAEFLPNSSVFVDKCQNCFCTNEVNISTQLNIISCEHIPCNTYCEPGYERQPVKGECCGRCVQTKCVIHTSDNSDLILSPGEFKNDPYNNCTIYSCVNIHNQLISSTSEITCPAFNEESCKPGTITFLPNGCCRTCAPLDSPTPCSVRQRKDFIVYKGCHSVDRVVMTECEGTCGTSSLYSAEANSMDHSCSCCRESRTTVREVELKCPTGHSVSHKYIYVESCSCQDTECSSSQSSELQSTEENDKASTLNRIKRAISLTAK
ncbi:mucin-2 isoform 1-T1 [Morphnus guianensis]